MLLKTGFLSGFLRTAVNGIINSLNITTQLFSIPGVTLLAFAPTKPALLTMTVRLPQLNIDYGRKVLILSSSSTHLD